MQQEYIFVLIFSLLLFRVVVIVFHEFGHAFASLLNSDGDVSVYIGSHGNPEKSFRFKIKRLECFIKCNVFKWSGGLCISHGKGISWKGRFLISLFGPITTLLLGIISIVFLQFIQNDLLFVILSAFAFSCIFDFIYNIIPKNTQIQLHDGTFTNNDGKQLVHLWNIRKVYVSFNKASNHYVAKEYTEAAELFEQCIAPVSKNKDVYKLTIASYLNAKNYEKAIELHKNYLKFHEDSFDIDDIVNVGVIEIYQENYPKALELFEKALELAPENHIILNNCGYVLGLLERYDEAIVHLDKAIVTDETFGYAWNNRGYCKIMSDQFEEGYADLQKSLQLDDKNSYVYCNLGLYHFKLKEYDKAYELYQKAFELDPETLKLQQYIDEVSEYI